MPTVPTFAVRETDVSRHNGGTTGVPLKPLRDDSAPSSPAPLHGHARQRSLLLHPARGIAAGGRSQAQGAKAPPVVVPAVVRAGAGGTYDINI